VNKALVKEGKGAAVLEWGC